MNEHMTVTVQTTIKAPLVKVWEYWTKPEHIVKWAFASDDWEASAAENNLRVGERFKTVMGAKDKSSSFDFTGTYTKIKAHEIIEYDIDDGRHVETTFEETPEGIKVTQTFEMEKMNPEEMQRSGWQAIMNNFKKYTEGT